MPVLTTLYETSHMRKLVPYQMPMEWPQVLSWDMSSVMEDWKCLAREARPEGSFIGSGTCLDECQMHDQRHGAPTRRDQMKILSD